METTRKQSPRDKLMDRYLDAKTDYAREQALKELEWHDAGRRSVA